MSSSKRGRKRNDNLPPNRARDVQRAFRARRAAHLQALEQRVAELEDENSCLRQALSLPPANRPPLGRGPTGKDRPKPYEPETRTSHLLSRQGSSSVESPSSTRPNSLSPNVGQAALPNVRHLQQIETTWDQVIPESDVQSSSASSTFSLPSLATPLSAKQLAYPYSPSTTTRTSLLRPNPFLSSEPSLVQNSSPLSDFGSPFLSQPRAAYAFAYEDINMHSHTPLSPIAPPQTPQRDSSVPYPLHRRSLTDPQFSLGPQCFQPPPNMPNEYSPTISRDGEQCTTIFTPDGCINHV